MKIIALLMLGAVNTAFPQTPGSQGIFEGSGDVGAPSHKGSVVYDPARKEYRITGGGANMWAARDDFFFVWKKMTGDCAVTASGVLKKGQVEAIAIGRLALNWSDVSSVQ